MFIDIIIRYNYLNINNIIVFQHDEIISKRSIFSTIAEKSKRGVKSNFIQRARKLTMKKIS